MPGETTLSVPLETVTPLFLAGAEPRGAPELRPPAFRGALRYWLRAALGGVLGDDVSAVRQAEAAVFGSTDGASPVTVRLRHGPLPRPTPYERQRLPSGRDDLYWSMSESGRLERGNRQEAKRFYPPGCAFTIDLSNRPGARATVSNLQQAAASI
jgi:CRISPR-associated protein Cmr1